MGSERPWRHWKFAKPNIGKHEDWEKTTRKGRAGIILQQDRLPCGRGDYFCFSICTLQQLRILLLSVVSPSEESDGHGDVPPSFSELALLRIRDRRNSVTRCFLMLTPT
jgi:hypothetical protein